MRLTSLAYARPNPRVLDVTMNEDYLRNRTGPGPENLAVMRRLALNLARLAADKLHPFGEGLKKPDGITIIR